MTPLVVIGDVHGNVSALRTMLERVESVGRPVVFVGDYVNGGSASALVLEELVTKKLAHKDDWMFLAGNHDLALLDYLGGGSFNSFAAIGGIATICSYVDHVRGNVRAAFAETFPEHHRRFLDDLLACYETDNVLISHVGFCVDKPDDRSKDAMARGGSQRVFSSPSPRPLVICGHYLQRSRSPFKSEHLICIDTGCGMANGPLTAVLLPEREFLSVG